MLTFPCSNTKLLIHEAGVTVGDRVHPFTTLKSLHTKNDPSLLKIRLSDGTAIVLEFSTPHIRDMAKNILIDRIKTTEEINMADTEYKQVVKNLRGIVRDPEGLVRSIARPDGHLHDGHLHDGRHDAIYLQRDVTFTPETFFSTLNQPLLDVFIKMNCSIEQFYNLLVSSFFHDLKNQKNSLDRLLAEGLRGRDAGLDYATRLNSYSLLSLYGAGECPRTRGSRPKPIEFELTCGLGEGERDRGSGDRRSGNGNAIANDDNDDNDITPVAFVRSPLTAELPLTTQDAPPAIPFEPSDFEAARDLCRLVYASRGKEIPDAMKFSETLKSLVEAKYGREALGYIERVVPSFYK